MSTKIKLFFAFLAVFALFSVYTAYDSFLHRAKVSLSANISQNTLPLPEEDPDHDGLSNRDESYWNTDPFNPDTDDDGYLDGEEVASGHDANKAGPDDLLVDRNVTAKLSDLAIAGLAEGSLKPDSPNYDKSLADLTLATMDDAMAALSPTVDLSKIQITDPSKENQIIYIKNIGPVIQSFMKAVTDQIGVLSDPKVAQADIFSAEVGATFISTVEELNKTYDMGLTVPVPENWKTEHLTLLQTVKTFSETYRAIAHGSDDPIKAAIAFSLLSTAQDDFTNLINSYFAKIKSEGLTSESLLK